MSAWIVRVVQEFEVELPDANAATAFMDKARARKMKGATLLQSVAYSAPKPPGPADVREGT